MVLHVNDVHFWGVIDEDGVQTNSAVNKNIDGSGIIIDPTEINAQFYIVPSDGSEWIELDEPRYQLRVNTTYGFRVFADTARTIELTANADFASKVVWHLKSRGEDGIVSKPLEHVAGDPLRFKVQTTNNESQILPDIEQDHQLYVTYDDSY